MRCHFGDSGDGTNSLPSGLNIWSATSHQALSVLKNIDKFDDNDFTTNGLSDLQALDSVSSSQKRKIFDCERDDFEERFYKIQRRKQLQQVTARANLVVDDNDDDFDEEDRIYEQMDWIERENIISTCAQENNEDEQSFQSMNATATLMYVPKLKWKEERRRLLRISMAKIRGVEDPEAYLRRSVLINNTVKRLQRDISVNYRCHAVTSSSSSFFHESLAYPNENTDSWDFEKTYVNKEQVHSETAFDFEYAASVVNNSAPANFSELQVQSDVSFNSLNFHVSFASFASEKPLGAFHHEVLHSSLNKNIFDEQILNEGSLSPRIVKQPAPIHMFSSQPCGLQYRNPIHDEDNSEYESTGSSSLIDSVVYHSLMASLET
ncbi:hypothetical protein X975_27063, partial [Stegodyphus mimosarum]